MFYIVNDLLTKLPLTLDASTVSSIVIASKVPVTSNLTVTQVAQHKYSIDISSLTSDTTVTISDGVTTHSMLVYADTASTKVFESWLEFNQLSELAEVVKKLGYDKLKEAALRANAIAKNLCSERSLNEILKLLEVDNNLTINRKWKKTESDHDYYAYDDLHSVSYANYGYTLTKELLLHYLQDNLNPWTNQLIANDKNLLVSLEDLYNVLSKAIPATMYFSSYAYVRLGLELVNMHIATCVNDMQWSSYESDDSIELSDNLQYEYKPFVYDLDSNVLIRTAEPGEPNSKSIYGTVLTVTSTNAISDLVIDDSTGKRLCQVQNLVGTVQLLLQPDLSANELAYSYRTMSGYLITGTKAITVHSCSDSLPIYAFSDQSDLTIQSSELHEIGVVNIMQQYLVAMRYCSGRTNFGLPKAYQVFYVPVSVDKLYVNDGLECKEYEVSETMQVQGFTLAKTELKVLNSDLTFVTTLCYVLQSEKLLGKYDISMHYYGTELTYAEQESRFLTVTVNPKIDAVTIQAVDGDNKAEPSTINGISVNAGNPMNYDAPANVVADILNSFEGLAVNTGLDSGVSKLASISMNAEELVLTYGARQVSDIRRQPGMLVSKVNRCLPNIPYLLYRQGCKFDLYADSNLIQSNYDCIVFAMNRSKQYKLVITGTYFSKTMTL
jgi:hypothetical protein